MTTSEWVMLLVVAFLGHVMALVWYLVAHRWNLFDRKIYDLPIGAKQVRREALNSLHAPMHAVFLAAFLWFGFFRNTSVLSFFAATALTFVWAEIWHYASHRAFHLKSLHWIHAEHHKSRLNTPLTAISFSFTEKLVFDVGMLVPLALLDMAVSLNFFGVATWYIGYLFMNSFAHANFEIRAGSYNRHVGKILTTTTYHALHHSRYTGNYGLATRFLDRLFGTEWDDYEPLYEHVVGQQRPLTALRERVEAAEPGR